MLGLALSLSSSFFFDTTTPNGFVVDFSKVAVVDVVVVSDGDRTVVCAIFCTTRGMNDNLGFASL